MKKLIFLVILIFSVQVFANDKIYSTETKADNKDIQVNLYYKIYIIENVVQSEKSNSIFEGVDVDKILNDVVNGTGKYSKQAKLATELCKRDEKLSQGLHRLFTENELKEITNKSSTKTNEALKNEIESLKLRVTSK